MASGLIPVPALPIPEPAEIRAEVFEPIGELLPEPVKDKDEEIPMEFAEVVSDLEYDDDGYWCMLRDWHTYDK